LLKTGYLNLKTLNLSL
jgi:hypothetical protein